MSITKNRAVKKRAVILFSGGLDSTTILAIANSLNYECYLLSFDYGQRHKNELENASNIAQLYKVIDHKIITINLQVFGNSALTSDIEVPKHNNVQEINNKIVPITYVPARNTIFLSYALAYCEIISSYDIFIGANAIDYSGYPDCRPEFIESFAKMANLATANSAQNNQKIKIHAPLINFDKSQIIKKGMNLGVDYSMTHSCYDPIIKNSKVISCKKCDSCLLRLKGFENAGLEDKILYQ
ncbi:MAG: 7-cyano-7-deazaguanine synthase QueC [Rickettsiales bacterium]|jgi:7-cyano-7-deazaguanine synthase|nr:7-cyano-7-deazaguanine synthase QueC [Rickettsiales bacterium]|tara:strand:+ start:3539 stop:4261 length:723 start_codon:yes stop_codon:yes gene_type:complete